MPNHVTTRCIVTGSDSEIARFRELMFKKIKDCDDEKSEGELIFDFNQLISMPEQLNIISDGWIFLLENQFLANTSLKAHLDEMRKHLAESDTKQKTFENFIQGVRNYFELGHATWYEWCKENWGTKWNSYSLSGLPEKSVSPFEFSFDTAWNFPTPVFKKLAEEFPLLEFECCCFDEGWNFAGDGCFNPPDGSQQFKIVDATKELYEVVYGKPYVEEGDE